MHRTRKGLTLIEVLIIVVMIGILLTISYTKFSNRAVKDATLSLKADVEAVRKAESNYFAQHNAYGNRAQLDSLTALAPADGNTLTITATATGYKATATNTSDAANPKTCSVEVVGGESAAASAKTICT